MIRSMTAFARKQIKDDWGTLTWELRSVNHRYLEMYLRQPEDFRVLEPKLRESANKALGRGKLEATLNCRLGSVLSEDITINDVLAKAVIETTRKLESIMENPTRPSAMAILQWPGVMIEPKRDITPMLDAARVAFDEALHELISVREREGARIKSLLEQRLQSIYEIIAKVRARHPHVLDAIRTKLKSRLADLEVDFDNNRFEQELVLIAQKLDVDEELDRLDSHCKELGDVLKREEPVGRRLDFIMQEFNREANTLASKSADSETTQGAVDLKVLIEQIREQVQNIE